MIRVAYIAYVPNLMQQKITLQPAETIDYYFATMAEFYDMIEKGIFEGTRVSMYSSAFYRELEKRVGTVPPEDAPESDLMPEKKRVVKKVSFGEG